ncbi:Metalloprotease TIKI2 [Nymphon striatum]|nr:Metalloprotease TIKI2 [Nymphon striatum]
MHGRGLTLGDRDSFQIADNVADSTGLNYHIGPTGTTCKLFGGPPAEIGLAIFVLNQTLNIQEKIRYENFTPPYDTTELIEYYNCGNLDSNMFNSAPIPSLPSPTLAMSDRRIVEKIDRYFRNELIYNRNGNMAIEIRKIIESNTDETIFFAFGAGHFIGANTVIDHLKSFGYEIEQVSDAYDLKLPKKLHEQKFKVQYQDFTFMSDFDTNNGRHHQKVPRVSHAHHSEGRKAHRNHHNNRTSHQRSKKDRTFNDLWVRITDPTPLPLPLPPHNQ